MVWVHDTVIPGTLITNRAHLGPDVFTATTRIEAADTHWDEFIHDRWYAGQAPPALPPVMMTNTGMAAVPEPIDPAERPGLLSLQRFWSFLPFIRR